MAVAVVEGRDYRILEDDYRREFFKHNKPKKTLTGREYYKCIYCGERIYLDSESVEVDHIIPKTRLKAGILWNPNKAWNLGASCKSCNCSKSNKLDQRVFKGFRNKILLNLGLSAKQDDETLEETDATTFKISLLIGVVSFFMLIVLPLIGLAYGVACMGLKVAKWATKVFIGAPVKATLKIVWSIIKDILHSIFIKHFIRKAVLVFAMWYVYTNYGEVVNKVFNVIMSFIK